MMESGVWGITTVSYTHLDVYKRQVNTYHVLMDLLFIIITVSFSTITEVVYELDIVGCLM